MALIHNYVIMAAAL